MVKTFVKTIGKVMDQGEFLAVGTVVAVDVTAAKNLVDDHFAVFCNEDGTPPKPDTDAAAADTKAEDAAKVKKALNDQYNANDLKAAAKEIGVEFAFDATKAAVIEAILAQGKAAQLLKK